MRTLLLAFLLALAFASSSAASTTVCGNVVNQTWTSAGSPYLVGCDVLVSGLTIQPGVRVVFLGNYLFEIAGTLTAVGTAQDSIVFTRPDSVAAWQGIYFNYSLPGSELAYCAIERATAHGIAIDHSQPAIHDCAIRLNSATTGGAGIFTNSALALQRCTINDNVVSGAASFGGGIYASAPLTLRHCVVSGNVVVSSNVTSSAWGGGISAGAGLQLFDCRIVHNVASSNSYNAWWSYGAYAYGGGVYSDSAATTIERCVVDSNSAVASGIAPLKAYGAGVFANHTLGVCNTEVARNQTSGSEAHASGIYTGVRGVTLLNCTLAYNSTWGIGSSNPDSVIIWNSILFFNNGGGAQLESPVGNVQYSNVQGGYAGNGNMAYNPLFASPIDVSIIPGSPCIDAGCSLPRMNDVCFLPSRGGVRNDMGKDGGAGACTTDERGPVSVSGPDASLPLEFSVAPNPARGGTRISFVTAHEGAADIAVWDVQGRRVAHLLNQRLAPGVHSVDWDGRGMRGVVVPGVYMIRLQTQGRSLTGRLALIR